MIGIDVVFIPKFSSKISKDYYYDRVFTENEKSYASKKSSPTKTLAGIFAAKEATIKAYNLNLSYILYKRIEILYMDNKPYITIDGMMVNAFLSISHDGDYAMSICKNNESYDINVDSKMQELLPKRDSNTSKTDYGRIAIMGGSSGMAGSVYMSSLAAMRMGAGLTYIIAPESISTVLQIKSNEQIIRTIDCDNFYYSNEILSQILNELDNKDVLAIGPGMARGKDLNKLIGKIIQSSDMPILIDADGLNALSENLDILDRERKIVLTPHFREFSRLTNLSVEKIEEDRENTAKNFAKDHGVILVLKSDKTIVTDGDRMYINSIGNPGMATAGSGDVLTGIISALLKRLDPYEASVLGVYTHSLAGDIAKVNVGEDSIIATDLIKYLPDAIKILRNE